jgi:DHA3 family tetracycline resistance protein-like MFS transporter
MARLSWRSRPDRVFLTIAATAAFVSTLVFTIAPIYRFRTAGLDDLELVLVGTVMEAAVFLFEIPTGVVADRWSRRWSVIIGHAGIGVGLLIEATMASFAGVLVGQAVWGLAYTFTSGATVAWVAGELGDPDRAVLRTLFLRASRLGSAGALVAVPLSFVLGINVSLRAPIIVGGVLSLVLAGWLVRAMAEAHFEPVPSPDRSTWRAMASSAAAGGRVIRASHALLFLTLALFLAGGASEAYDRYIEKYLLGLDQPGWPGWSALTWLAVVGWLSAALGIVVPWWFERRHAHLPGNRQQQWIVGLIATQVVALLVLAMTGSFLLAAAISLLVNRVRSLRSSLLGSWIVPLTPKDRRATVLSTMEQADSISQVTVGPAMGVIGQVAGIPAALATSAVLLAPAALAVRHAARTDVKAGHAPAKIGG